MCLPHRLHWLVCRKAARRCNSLMDQYGFLEHDFQLAVAMVLIVTVLEMARRSIDWPLPLVAVLALSYGLFGIISLGWKMPLTRLPAKWR